MDRNRTQGRADAAPAATTGTPPRTSQLVALASALAMALAVAGCADGGLFGSSTTRVTFSLDSAARALGSRAADETATPNEIITMDVSRRDSEPRRVALLPGENSLSLAKNGLHMVGFVSNPAIARAAGARSLAGGIQTIGNLQIVTAGLNSLPLSSAAQDQLALGALSAVDGGYASGLSLEDSVYGFGYDGVQLGQIATFDSQALKFLNPDIDGDWLYDSEQGYEWEFWASYSVSYGDPAGFAYDGAIPGILPSTSPSDLGARGTGLMINFHKGFTDPPAGPMTLERYEPGSETPAEAIALRTSLVDGFHQRSYAGDYLEDGQPRDGDYRLYSPADPARGYWFRRMRFLHPTAGYEGILMLQYSLVSDAGGNLTGFRYRWIKVQGGRFILADPEEVRLRNWSFFINLWLSNGLHASFGSDDNAAGAAGNWTLDLRNEANEIQGQASQVSGPAYYDGGTIPLGALRLRADQVTSHTYYYEDVFNNYLSFSSER